ncbi:MAG: rela/spot domain protein, partial [Segetibacter sp.]|nr:rela/spot domain protein [Segetibacter sp.]
MDKIANITSLIAGLVEIYDADEFQSKLEKTKRSISKRFEALLNAKAHEFNLITRNSIRNVPYFSIVGRVKEKDSFHEKLIRGNLIYSFLRKQNFRSKEDILIKRTLVRKLITQVADDIIGIKIVTEVEEDCKNVINLLKFVYNENLGNKKDLYLNPDELDNQPLTMRNGLEYYKISGTYKSSIKFELQIKSKLLSVWGDMDHAMFYKDYSVSPIRENVKEAMVHLGNIIKQIDSFLLQIRQSGNTFSQNREVITFTEELA